jgi:HAD superfamily phosphatase (TIGR01668 family)
MNSKLYPCMRVGSVYELTPEWLKSRGFRAVICDLDDTLTPYYDTNPNPGLVKWLNSLNNAGILVYILSNWKKKRIAPLCKKFGIEFATMAMKPLPFAFNRAIRKLGVNKNEVVAIGDQIFTDIVGGNLAGIHTILVEPIAYKPGKGERLKRKLEKPYRCAKPLKNMV